MFLAFKNQIFFAIVKDFLLVLIGFIFSVSIKGFVKAVVARILGDRTPQDDGFLTLNPVGHCDLIQIIPITLIFVGISRIISGSNFSSLLAMVVIAFLESAIYPMNFDSRAKNAGLKISAIQLSGILTGLVLFIVPIPLIIKFGLYDNGGPLSEVLRDILSNISVFSCIRLIIHLPPIPPREGFYVIQPFISQKFESFLEKISENIFASIFFSLISAIILLPLLVMAFNFSLSTFVIFFYKIKSFAVFLTTALINFIKNSAHLFGF